jgi:hypothetical protein
MRIALFSRRKGAYGEKEKNNSVGPESKASKGVQSKGASKGSSLDKAEREHSMVAASEFAFACFCGDDLAWSRVTSFLGFFFLGSVAMSAMAGEGRR